MAEKCSWTAGCESPAASDSKYCELHRDLKRRENEKYKAAHRKKPRASSPAATHAPRPVAPQPARPPSAAAVPEPEPALPALPADADPVSVLRRRIAEQIVIEEGKLQRLRAADEALAKVQ